MIKIKRFIVFFISLIICISAINAEETNKYIKGERTENNNYGVSKKWEVNSTNETNVLRTPLVDETKKVYDFSDVLSDAEEENLLNQIKKFEEKYSTELIIVTYDLAYSIDSQNETFAADFYDYNSFGLQYELYDGIVLFRNTYSLDPYFDIYTFGNAQLYFDEYRYDYILDGIYDNLHNGDYLSGFTRFISYVNNFYSQGVPKSLKDYKVDEMGYLQKQYTPPYLVALIISAVVSATTIAILVSKNKMVKKATLAETYLDKSSIKYTKLIDKFITSTTTHYTISSSSGSGGGYHSSSGSSGGGHSSGGGRHG